MAHALAGAGHADVWSWPWGRFQEMARIHAETVLDGERLRRRRLAETACAVRVAAWGEQEEFGRYIKELTRDG